MVQCALSTGARRHCACKSLISRSVYVHTGLPTFHKRYQERVLSAAGCLQLLKSHVSDNLDSTESL